MKPLSSRSKVIERDFITSLITHFLFSEFDSEQYLVTVIRFLNAVALTPVDIEVRQNLRNEYEKVGLSDCIEYLQTRFPEGNQVRSQVEVYLEEAGYDKEQEEKAIEGINIDLNDVGEIALELQKRSKVVFLVFVSLQEIS